MSFDSSQRFLGSLEKALSQIVAVFECPVLAGKLPKSKRQVRSSKVPRVLKATGLRFSAKEAETEVGGLTRTPEDSTSCLGLPIRLDKC